MRASLSSLSAMWSRKRAEQSGPAVFRCKSDIGRRIGSQLSLRSFRPIKCPMVATFTYSTAGSNPGDPLTISAEVPYAVATTGRYTWKLEVIAGPLDQTITGSTFVVANDNSLPV